MNKLKHLIVIPTGGLCNRLRVIASVLKVVDTSKTKVEIFWHKNEECFCDFEDILQPIENITICNSPKGVFYKKPEKRNLYLPVLINFIFNPTVKYLYELSYVWDGTFIKEILFFISKKLNLQKNNKKSNNVRKLMNHKKVIITTCQPIVSDYNLSIFHPSTTVDLKLQETKKMFFENNTILGCHIRRTDNIQSINNSPDDLFISKVRKYIQENESALVYLATDDNSIKEKFKKTFGGGKVFTLDIPLNRNTVEGMIYATVELFLLSICSRIYGSFYSSFSYEASKINGIPLEIIQ